MLFMKAMTAHCSIAAPPEPVLLQQLLASAWAFPGHTSFITAQSSREKIFRRLIAAYRRMLARNPQLDFDLVLAGPLAWQHEETVNAAADNLIMQKPRQSDFDRRAQ